MDAIQFQVQSSRNCSWNTGYCGTLQLSMN